MLALHEKIGWFDRPAILSALPSKNSQAMEEMEASLLRLIRDRYSNLGGSTDEFSTPLRVGGLEFHEAELGARGVYSTSYSSFLLYLAPVAFAPTVPHVCAFVLSAEDIQYTPHQLPSSKVTTNWCNHSDGPMRCRQCFIHRRIHSYLGAFQSHREIASAPYVALLRLRAYCSGLSSASLF